jgi:acetyltransferase-like isoleucine patch superfamily enzyme
MSLAARIRRGEGPVWGGLKRAAKAVLSFHLPSGSAVRPFWRAMYALHVGVREGWIWARRFFWCEPLFRSQCQAVGSRFQMEELPYIQGRGQIVIGDGVRLSGKPMIAFNHLTREPELLIGDGVFVGHLCEFRIGRRISIGRNCLLAGGVSIADYDGHPLGADARRAGQPSRADEIRPVTIGNDVWIGAGAVVLKGVKIGDRAVVGAHAVVTKDVPPDAVVAGNPARVVKDLTRSAIGRELAPADPRLGLSRGS